MNRNDCLLQLHAHAAKVRAMGVTSLYLYGSTALDEAKPSSDIDLYIDYDPTSRFNAFDLVGVKQFLEDQLGSSVDVATRDGLHPRLKHQIELSAVRVF